MGENETGPTTRKKRVRPVVRIGILLMSHHVIFSVACYVAGVVALFLLPVLAKNTYISENALMPGSANNMLSNADVTDASKLVSDIMGLKAKSENAGIEVPLILGQHITNLGAEVSYHRFHPKPDKFHLLHFFSSHDVKVVPDNVTCSHPGMNTVGIIRAPSGDGKEAIVLVTPYSTVGADMKDALSLGVAYSVFSLLSRVSWLAKDIIWLAADTRYGEHESVAAWLREYYSPSFTSLSEARSKICPANRDDYNVNQNLVAGKELPDGFRRAGTMAAALVIKVLSGNNHAEDTLGMYAEASNGQMPNLDLINVVNYLAVHREGMRVEVEMLWSLMNSKCLRMFGQVIELVGNVARSLNPQWRFGIPVADYVEGAATLASSLHAQALGIPTGPHGAFRDYQIDAVTLVISPKVSVNSNAKQREFLSRSGRLVEGVVRSVNNLLEKFHQSFFLYLLTGPSKFVSVGVYMIPFALLIAPLPLMAASLYANGNKPGASSNLQDLSSNSEPPIAPVSILESWRWLGPAKTVFVVHAWAIVVSVLPSFISKIQNLTSTTSLLSWILLSLFSLHLMYLLLGSRSNQQGWQVLKSVTISVAFIGLCLMSIVNFATAEIGALLLVPLCLMTRPLKSDLKASRKFKAIAGIFCNLILGLICFPPVTFFLLKGLAGGYAGIDIGEFWSWVESLWAWNSATYLYIVLVHLPCWVLCILILSHPS
ncbi:Glycosylphosphatidylinositol anchor attachment 1 protein-like protein [Drosera capensis]